jgi:type III restriction enzyme
MELKEYQLGVLQKLDHYLTTLEEKRIAAEEYAEFQRSKGRSVKPTDYCRETWEQLNLERRLPLLRHGDESTPSPWLPRHDELMRPVPNICLKVPTGGGKTLLAAASVERIQADYFKRQTGLLLWIVPSEAIYKQTWKQLANREHPYRQMLERASGGRVKVLEKADAFTRRDVDDMLCVLLLMLPSAARQSKETLRMFRDSGRFTSFFPPEDDGAANEQLHMAVPNLDFNDLGEMAYQGGGLPGDISLKQSLGNVLRLTQPIIILDEGHKAYSDTARETLLGFNPRFILELSATPNTNGRHQSNVLVNVPGADLKDEQMIKLPINVINEAKGDWKQTLTLAYEKLGELARESEVLRASSGRYIRPILLIRVERTGRGQEEKNVVHADHAKQYLMGTLGVKEEEIRLKTSENNELGDEDLLAETSLVRYIITKDALREGWDCPFAYVLAILSNTTAQTALTQMIGRVLRQPHALATGRPALDECYVFTFDQDVTEAVDSVRHGLEEEGMADLATSVRGSDAGSGSTYSVRRETIPRRKGFRKLQIVLPRVLRRQPGISEGFRPFDYERDILSMLDWESFEHLHPDASLSFDENRARTRSKITINRQAGEKDQAVILLEQEDMQALPAEDLDRPFLVRHLLDVLPNPWQAMRVLDNCLNTLRENGFDAEQIHANRFELLKNIKKDVGHQVDAAGELVFRESMNRGNIAFKLAPSNASSASWSLPDALEADASSEEPILRLKNGGPLEKSLFEKVFARDFNPLERDVARYLDASPSVYGWHRLPVGRDSYAIQGWQRHKVYPDFLVCVKESKTGELGFLLLETKGDHLEGNADTNYKRKLFGLLEESFDPRDFIGGLKLQLSSRPIRFRMVMGENWQAALQAEGI